MVGDNYVFATGDQAAPRLAILEKVYGPSTRMHLNDAGIGPGMSVVEVGCGVGYTSCQLARGVLPDGHVRAIDVSGDQLRLARENATRAGIENVEFVEASALSTGLASESADVVYARLLLSHLRQPGEGLREFFRILRPGGTLLVEDLIASQAYSSPESPAFVLSRDMAMQFCAKNGVDYAIGLRLAELAREAGFHVDAIRTVQPAYSVGDEKRWWEYSVREAGPMFVKTGLTDAEGLEALMRQLTELSLDPDVLIAQPVMTQIRAVRPVS